MFLVYTPEGGDEQQWHVRLGRLKTMEMEAIEKHTGLAYATEFKAQLIKGQTSARRALLWTMLRRQHPTLKYADVDFYDDELNLRRDRDEIAEEIAAVEGMSDQDISPADRQMTIGVLRQQLATASEPPGKAGGSPSDATSTR
jgi:hypothetical protein